MLKEEKQAIMAEYATHEGDTGSPEVQIAILTNRINAMTLPSTSRFTRRITTAEEVFSRWLVREEAFSLTSQR